MVVVVEMPAMTGTMHRVIARKRGMMSGGCLIQVCPRGYAGGGVTDRV